MLLVLHDVASKDITIPAPVYKKTILFLNLTLILGLVFQCPRIDSVEFKMLFSSLLVLASVTVVSKAADPVLETRNFNITQALLDHGVDVSKLPVSSKDAMRSDTGCAAAVSSTILDILFLA